MKLSVIHGSALCGWPHAPRFAPEVGDQALWLHGALRCAGAAGGVDQQRQRVVLVGDEHRCGRQRLPAVEHVGQRFHTHRAARLRQPRPGGVERLALVVDLGVVVEDDQPRGRVPGQRQFNGIVEIGRRSRRSRSARSRRRWAAAGSPARWSAAERIPRPSGPSATSMIV